MGIRGNAWTRAEDDLLLRCFEDMGAEGMKASGHLPHRNARSIVARASALGMAYVKPRMEPLTPVPRMGLLESLECVRLAKWKGPVTPGLVGWRIAA